MAATKVKILVTGGTFDKEYNELDGTLIFAKTHIYEMLKSARCHADVSIRTIMLIDSLDMTEYDRNVIADYCKDSEEDKIVITHGTDTMCETAKVLAAKSELRKKTIVLTGAMVSYVFGSSDGQFNLGSALSFVQALPPNIYITMNGKIFTWDNVRKNKDGGFFESLKPEAD